MNDNFKRLSFDQQIPRSAAERYLQYLKAYNDQKLDAAIKHLEALKKINDS